MTDCLCYLESYLEASTVQKSIKCRHADASINDKVRETGTENSSQKSSGCVSNVRPWLRL